MACSQGEHKFRCHVVSVSKLLYLEETNELGYIYGLPETKYKDKPTLEVLKLLQQRDIISATKPEGLIGVFKQINRTDLVKMTDRYIKSCDRPHKMYKDNISGLGDSTEKEQLQVARMHNQASRSHFKILEGVVQTPAAKIAIKEAGSHLECVSTLLQRAEDSSEEEDLKSRGKILIQ